MIALVDVGDPSRARVNEVLWQRSNGPEIEPSCPVYVNASRRCYFVGATKSEAFGLYVIDHGKAGPAKRIGPEGDDPQMTDLSTSPDGRYLLYSSHGVDPRAQN
jgi:hypothetical protein